MAGLKNMLVSVALRKLKDMALASMLEGIGTIDEIEYEDGKVFLQLKLEGLPTPVKVECSDIVIAPDGSSVTINNFSSSVACVDTALGRFVAGRTIDVPEGAARFGLSAASKVL